MVSPLDLFPAFQMSLVSILVMALALARSLEVDLEMERKRERESGRCMAGKNQSLVCLTYLLTLRCSLLSLSWSSSCLKADSCVR